MAEDPIAVLERWTESGAHWRVAELAGDHIVVELLTCLGEPVDRVESASRDLIAYVRRRGMRSGSD